MIKLNDGSLTVARVLRDTPVPTYEQLFVPKMRKIARKLTFLRKNSYKQFRKSSDRE